jgi:hypothetical protein
MLLLRVREAGFLAAGATPDDAFLGAFREVFMVAAGLAALAVGVLLRR